MLTVTSATAAREAIHSLINPMAGASAVKEEFRAREESSLTALVPSATVMLAMNGFGLKTRFMPAFLLPPYRYSDDNSAGNVRRAGELPSQCEPFYSRRPQRLY